MYEDDEELAELERAALRAKLADEAALKWRAPWPLAGPLALLGMILQAAGVVVMLGGAGLMALGERLDEVRR